MSPLAVHLLRRLAVLALVTAVLLATVPRLLTELGVVGPTVEEELEQAQRAIDAAREYGAGADDPAWVEARRHLERARGLAAQGERRDARSAARGARAKAVESQRRALVAQKEGRRRAQAVVEEVDGQINRLEALYEQVTPALDKPAVSRLLSLMKEARRVSGTLFLAYEEGRYEQVLTGGKEVKETLSDLEATLLRAAPPAP